MKRKLTIDYPKRMNEDNWRLLQSNLHGSFGDASDPYAARAARIITGKLRDPANAADLENLRTAHNAWAKARIPRTEEGEKMLEKLFDAEHEVIRGLVKKYCPDNWEKDDLNWPPKK